MKNAVLKVNERKSIQLCKFYLIWFYTGYRISGSSQMLTVISNSKRTEYEKKEEATEIQLKSNPNEIKILNYYYDCQSSNK